MSQKESNARVLALLTSQHGTRNATWAHELEQWLPRATFARERTLVDQIGSLNYLRVSVAIDEKSQQSFDDVVRSATDAGCGLSVAVNGDVALGMSFGVLATYRMFQTWTSPPGWNGGLIPNGSEVLRRSEVIHTGEPTLEYLPLFVRAAVVPHLEALGVHEPRVTLVLWPERSDHRDLAFNIPRSKFTPEAFADAMRSLMWFLPEGYQCVPWELVANLGAASATL